MGRSLGPAIGLTAGSTEIGVETREELSVEEMEKADIMRRPPTMPEGLSTGEPLPDDVSARSPPPSRSSLAGTSGPPCSKRQPRCGRRCTGIRQPPERRLPRPSRSAEATRWTMPPRSRSPCPATCRDRARLRSHRRVGAAAAGESADALWRYRQGEKGICRSVCAVGERRRQDPAHQRSTGGILTPPVSDPSCTGVWPGGSSGAPHRLPSTVSVRQ